ncbi:acyl-CoA thioesterase [Verrucomicrobiaceae bacterium R5-34]|uniref:Acyl-CoA thioesterase n=1 Tax=Oceaniferula flava TaxID=2800421 RepID=A0AAE2SEI8_9BACT|nr:hotdog domain-containing protein [Oceaniferula flavus]MBK1830068.1 acyl-CoA thioesterase [Verrucomicrobiaceae bacterium R5-34]MBK1855085.1 acyl-CoA thioesterase [Oceaniferula flavus]MBM1136391.1 acyl-CoA thioesterase [Oceaniferula flavus]
MKFYSRKWIKPEDLNAHNTLFGGRLLAWIDEDAAIYAMCQCGSKSMVTKFVSEINFISSAQHGDVVEIGFDTVEFGTTSITMTCLARNKNTKQNILSIERIVFVKLDENGRPSPHGKTHKKTDS